MMSHHQRHPSGGSGGDTDEDESGQRALPTPSSRTSSTAMMMRALVGGTTEADHLAHSFSSPPQQPRGIDGDPLYSDSDNGGGGGREECDVYYTDHTHTMTALLEEEKTKKSTPTDAHSKGRGTDSGGGAASSTTRQADPPFTPNGHKAGEPPSRKEAEPMGPSPESNPPTITTPQPPLPQQTPPSSPSVLFRRSGFLPTYKVLVVGDVAVGKTNLLSRYCSNTYDPTAAPTIGIEFVSRQLEVPTGRVGEVQPVVVQLWDTAGQERCSVISTAYYRNAVGAMLVYDVTRRETFLNIPRWLGQVRSLANEDCICVVVGNKTDVPQAEWAVTPAEADQLAHTLDMRHYHASACNGEGVLQAFTQMVLSVNAVQSLKYAPVLPPAMSPVSPGGVFPRSSSNNNTNNKSNPEPDLGEITRASASSFYSAQERTLWTLPSTVPQGSLAIEPTPSRHGARNGAAMEAWGSPLSPPSARNGSPAANGGCCYHTPLPSSPSLPRQQPYVACTTSPEPGRRKKQTLDLRGFGGGGGGGEHSDAAALGGGGGCAC